MMGPRSGDYFDGQSAAPQPVHVQLTANGLALFHCEGQFIAEWPFDRLRRLDDRYDAQRLRLCHAEGAARLTLTDPELIARIRHDYGRLKRGGLTGDPKKLRAIAIGLATAVASLVFLLYLILPWLSGAMARYFPVQAETQMGLQTAVILAEELSGQEGEAAFCANPQGQLALQAMAERLGIHQNNALPYPVTVQVIDAGYENAFALPGGHIVLTRGLIEMAHHPNAIAGVMAHEWGHVAERDPLRIAIQSGLIGIVAGLAMGDVTGVTSAAVIAQLMITNSYSRDVERAADAFALARMKDKGLALGPYADFMEKLLADQPDDWAALVSSHPGMTERLRALKDQPRDGADILTPQEWKDLRDICAP